MEGPKQSLHAHAAFGGFLFKFEIPSPNSCLFSFLIADLLFGYHFYRALLRRLLCPVFPGDEQTIAVAL